MPESKGHICKMIIGFYCRYEEVMISLVQAILKKIQSEKTLDDEKTNSDVSVSYNIIFYYIF